MAAVAESSSLPLQNDKPVIVRVKRKAFQHRVDAFWLEINERPLKRALLDFEKLSVSESSSTREELKITKILVHHVETVTSSENTIDVLRSFVGGENEERRRVIKSVNKQDELLVKAKKSQEVLSRNARYEQIWRSRKGKQDSQEDKMCRLYDIVKVDVHEQEMKVKQMDTNLENHEMMAGYLPLLREVLPAAAIEIETDIHNHMSRQVSSDDYVYDFYVTNYDNVDADSAIQYPLVQVDDDDDYYDGPDNSDYETDDSNAENNPLNDYPEEEASENDDDDEVTNRSSDEESEDESRTSGSQSQSLESESPASNEDENSGPDYWSDNAEQLPEDEMHSERDVDSNSGYEWR